MKTMIILIIVSVIMTIIEIPIAVKAGRLTNSELAEQNTNEKFTKK